MELGSRQTIFGALAVSLLSMVAIVPASGQAPAPANKLAAPAGAAQKPASAGQASGKPLLIEQVYGNVKILRGMPVDEFMDTMGFIASSLGTNCTHCHDEAIGSGDASRHKAFEIETPNLRMARKMILMVNAINKEHFDGQKLVTCYSCHRSEEDPPPVIPSMAAQYVAPPDEEPDSFPSQSPGAPAPEQVLDKYIQALGGSQRLAGLKSIIIHGTYAGYDTDLTNVPMDLYEKAPNMRTMVMHTPFGDRSEVFNGTAGWNATPDTSEPRPVLDITGGRLNGQKVAAQMAFPAQIKTVLTKWISIPSVTISGGEPGAQNVKDRKVTVVQGLDAGRLPVKLYFDQSGLLVRTVSYINTAIGLIPAQVDYTNFKDVNGIKFPYHWVATWTDGQSIYNVTNIQINAPIDDKMFSKPAPPKLLAPVLKPAPKR